MEREEFLKYRNQITEILLATEDTKAEASYLCASALNEAKIEKGMIYQIVFLKAVDYAGNDKT